MLGHFVSKDVKIASTAHVDRFCLFEGMNAIHEHAFFHGRLGYGSYVGNGCNLSADIGRFSSIGPLVRSNSGKHPYEAPFVSTSPCFYSIMNTEYQNGGTFANRQMYEERSRVNVERGIDVSIGSDCWIGEGAFLVGGIRIGDGAVVLARAVVTKDVPPYTIVGGVPAKVIRKRYDEKTIEFLLKSKWWENSKEWFVKNWKLLSDIDSLKRYIANNMNI